MKHDSIGLPARRKQQPKREKRTRDADDENAMEVDHNALTRAKTIGVLEVCALGDDYDESLENLDQIDDWKMMTMGCGPQKRARAHSSHAVPSTLGGRPHHRKNRSLRRDRVSHCATTL